MTSRVSFLLVFLEKDSRENLNVLELIWAMVSILKLDLKKNSSFFKFTVKEGNTLNSLKILVDIL